MVLDGIRGLIAKNTIHLRTRMSFILFLRMINDNGRDETDWVAAK